MRGRHESDRDQERSRQLVALLNFEQNPQSVRRNNFPGEQVSRRFLLLSEHRSASNYPGAAGFRAAAAHRSTPPACLPEVGGSNGPGTGAQARRGHRVFLLAYCRRRIKVTAPFL